MEKPWCMYCKEYWYDPREHADRCSALRYRDPITGKWTWMYGNPSFRVPQKAIVENLCRPRLTIIGKMRKMLHLQIRGCNE